MSAPRRGLEFQLAKTRTKARTPYHTSGCGQGRGVFFIIFFGSERIAKVGSFLSAFRFKN